MSAAEQAVAYMREHFMMVPAEKADLLMRINSYAESNGFVVVAAFAERLENSSLAFDAMVNSATNRRVRHLIVPSMMHLALRSSSELECERLESKGIQVHVAVMPPP